MSQQFSDIFSTKDGSFTVKHPQHGEAFHSFDGAEKEAAALYLEGSGYLDALRNSSTFPVIAVLDVGLGLGYNALQTIEAWLRSLAPPSLELLSVEIDEGLLKSFLSTRAPWQENWSVPRIELVSSLEANSDLNDFRLRLIHPRHANSKLLWRVHNLDAARENISPPKLKDEGFDFVWHDPFSPKHNPSLWTPDFFEKLNRLCCDGATLMTYSVSRLAKDSLSNAGWSFELIPTTTTKRSWLKAKLVNKLT